MARPDAKSPSWKLVVARDVYIHHVGSQAFGKDLEQLVKTNAQKLVDKWGIPLCIEKGFLQKQEQE